MRRRESLRMSGSIAIDRAEFLQEDKKSFSSAKRGFFEFLCVAVPKVAGGTSILVLNVVLMRHFGPEQFGIYAICTTGILLVDAIFGSAVDLGVVRLATEKMSRAPALAFSIQKAGVLLKVAAVLIVSGILIAWFALSEGHLLHKEQTYQLVTLSCFATLGLMLLRSAQTSLQIGRRFLSYGALELFQMSLKYGGIAALLIFGAAQPERVLLFYAVGPLLAFFIWLIQARKNLRGAPPLSLAGFRDLTLTVKWFVLTFGLGALLSRLDIFMVSSLSSISQAGIFGAAQTFALVPQLIGSYLALIYSPRVIPYLQTGNFSDFFRQFQTNMFAVGILIFVLAVPSLNLFGKWILPGRFVAAQSAILVLLPGALAGLATFPVTVTLLMFVRPRFLFLVDCMAAPIVALLYMYVIPRYGALGAAWVTSSSCVTRAMIAQVTAWRFVECEHV
jgi:O-antigen/teichoic acid export membrane protein